MKALIRSVLSVFAAFIVASGIMMVIEMFNGRVLHPELAKAAETATSTEAMRALLAGAPTSVCVASS